MSDADARGPQVDAAEDLYRAIHLSQWWNGGVTPPRPRSAAFNWPKFSVNIASEIGVEGAVKHMIDVLDCPAGAIVAFNCGRARELGFDARRELDEKHRENKAHAHFYYDGSNSSRKTRAKKLAKYHCRTVRQPSF